MASSKRGVTTKREDTGAQHKGQYWPRGISWGKAAGPDRPTWTAWLTNVGQTQKYRKGGRTAAAQMDPLSAAVFEESRADKNFTGGGSGIRKETPVYLCHNGAKTRTLLEDSVLCFVTLLY